MVIGTGIDIIEVERVAAAAKREAFISKVFTEAERDYFHNSGSGNQSIAGIFAAKEATAKALTVGFRGIRWTDIEILHDENGRPYTVLRNGALERMQALEGKKVHISISHIKELAVAQAILED